MQLSFSIEETCAATGLGRTKIYALIRENKLKARKSGKRTLILKADLEEFLTNLETYPSQKAEG